MCTGYFELQAKKKKKKVKNIEFEVFTKISSLSPRLAIPILHIVIKHLKVSLIVYFLRMNFSPLSSRADCHLKSAHNVASDGARSR